MRTSLLAALVVFATALPGCRDKTALMNMYGFIALRPPSNLYQAGAVVVVKYSEGGIGADPTLESLRLVCGPRASLGPEYMPIESDTMTGMQKFASKQTFHMEGEALDKIKTKTKMDEVQDIEIQLENARIVELQDTDIWENISNRSEQCHNAILARMRAGYEVTMVSSNIIADIIYRVKFRSDVHIDKKAQMDKMKEIAVSLGGGHTFVDESSIHAKNLAVGLKTDSFLLAISLPNGLQEHVRKRQSRHLEASEIEADPGEADAPIAHPHSSILPTRKKAKR